LQLEHLMKGLTRHFSSIKTPRHEDQLLSTRYKVPYIARHMPTAIAIKEMLSYRSSTLLILNGVCLPPWHTGQSRLGLYCTSKIMPHVLHIRIF
jgi:hypothetical protein